MSGPRKSLYSFIWMHKCVYFSWCCLKTGCMNQGWDSLVSHGGIGSLREMCFFLVYMCSEFHYNSSLNIINLEPQSVLSLLVSLYLSWEASGVPSDLSFASPLSFRLDLRRLNKFVQQCFCICWLWSKKNAEQLRWYVFDYIHSHFSFFVT